MHSLSRVIIVLLISIISIPSFSQEISKISDFFEKADLFFKKYAQDGGIKYDKLKADQSLMRPLLSYIEKTPISDIGKFQKKAYLINCYNLLVIGSVIEKYPIVTVRNTDGFFKKVQHTVGGTKMTLDHLEYKIIFKEYSDPRLHFTLVCAAKGCPPIPSFAYTPDNLSEQMNTQCQLALDNPSFLYLEDKEGIIKLSPIFDWYKDDFFPTIHEFINAHRTQKLPTEYALAFYEYDWRLNTWE